MGVSECGRFGVWEVGRAGFTLIEIMVSVTIMVMAMTMVFMTFNTVVNSTGEAESMMRDLRHGEFAVDQAADALRSASYFTNDPEKYGFWLEDDVQNGVPADIISWVTSSPAFMPRGGGLEAGLHRLTLSIEDDEDGEPALHAAAWQHLLDPEDDDFEEVEPWLVSPRIVGIDCRIYNESENDWKDEWDEKSKLPRFIRLDFYIKAREEGEPPTVMTRMIHIPVGTFAKNAGRYSDRDSNSDAPIPQPNFDPGDSIQSINPGTLR